ncbi:MAG: redoxin domain-containing protein [Lentisphaerae bacterium]|nr:redoxin domain-containing protein [Lentisphaerota bacterium]
MKVLYCLAVAGLLAVTGCATPPGGDAPSDRLPVPDRPSERAYLGLPPGSAEFALRDITADVVVVHLLDMYCALCHRAAPGAAQLFEALRARDAAGRVKMIGIGVRNTPLEIEAYRQRFTPPYPVLADPDRRLTQSLSYTRVPSFLALQRMPDGQFRQFYTRVGYFTDPSPILERVLQRLPPGEDI